MSFFFRAIAGILKSKSIPVFKSFFKAYQQTTSGPRNSSSSESSSGKRHPLDEMFKKMLSKTNLSAPPLDRLTAMKILNIELKQKEADPRQILDRYYTLWKKNDPANGGTVYLQSKVFAAKQVIMNEFPNAAQVEQQFYKQVVQPEEKAQEEKKRQQKQQEEKVKKVENKEEEKK